MPRKSGRSEIDHATTPEPRAGTRLWAWGLLVIFVLALAVRVAAVHEARDEPYHVYLALDAATYHRIALQGDPAEPFWQPPLYPWAMRAIYAAFGTTSPIAVRIVQCLLGALACVGIAVLARRFAGAKAALAAGIAAALYGTLVYFDGEVLPASLGVALVVALLLVVTAAPRAGSLGARARWPITGALLGAGALLLPTLVFPAALLAIWIWRREGLRAVLVITIVAALPIAAVAARNARYEPTLVPVSWNGGLNFYLGNNPAFPETVGIRPGIAWGEIVSRAFCESGVTRRADESAWYYREGLRYAAGDPLGFAGDLGRKTLATISAEEIGRNRDVYLARGESRVMALLLWPWGFPFAVLAAAAAAGLAALARARAVPWPAVLVAIGILIGSVVFFPTARYRVPAVPALLVLAAAGLPRVRAKDAVAGAVVLGLSLVPHGMPRIPAWETWSEIGSNLDQWGDANGAITFYERALREAPESADVHLLLGLALGKTGQSTLARERLEQASALAPDASVVWQALGLAYSREKRVTKAREAMQRAVETDACNRRAKALLAHMLMDDGLWERARTAVDEAERAFPRGDRMVAEARARLDAFTERKEAGTAAPGR